MAKFDSYNTEHINLLNYLYNKASPFFAEKQVYCSDIVRDVECLTRMPEDGQREWIVGGTMTVILTPCDNNEAEQLYQTYGKALFRITRTTSAHGTVNFSAELIKQKEAAD